MLVRRFPTGEDRCVPEIVRAMTPRFAAPAVRGEGEGRIALGNRISVLTVAASAVVCSPSNTSKIH